MKIFFNLMFLLLLTACGNNDKNPEGPLSELKIYTTNTNLVFMVETASSDEEKARGLMFRKHLNEDKGMIFDMRPAHQTAMWMKNTYIPLDIVFVGEDNRINGFFENAQPFSEKLMVSPRRVKAVIELKAGSIKKHQIKTGDFVSHAILKN